MIQSLEIAFQKRVTVSAEKKRQALDKKLSRLNRTDATSSNDNWVSNLSNRYISGTEKEVLIKGMNYNFKDAPKRLFLAELEHSMKTNGVTEEAQQQIRQTVVPNMMRKVTNCNLTHQEKQALRSLKADKDIIILPADKGRLTVVMDKQDYISNARQLLSDTTTYREIDTDPSQKLMKEINKNLKMLQDVNEITESER